MDYLKNIKWFSQGALRFVFNDKVVYTDPFDIDGYYNDADYIFFTHPHFDHTSPENIDKVIKENTKLIIAESVAGEISSYANYDIIKVNSGDVIDFRDFSVNVMPAYNIVKTQCHAKENGWVGYLFTFGELKLYYTSDTEYIPEMESIQTDVIFLPLGQTYTMECVEDAVKAVKATKAKIAVPIHFGKYEGTKEDAEKFCALVGDFAEAVML